jgi:hypothetical protein
MRLFVALVVLSIAGGAVAHAEVLDVKKVVKQLEACTSEQARALVGTIEKAETIGKRPASKIVQVFGEKARGYVVWQGGGMCTLVPIVGKPAAFLKGNFGNGATTAFALDGRDCAPTCLMVVSLKTKDDQLVDVLPLPDGCSGSVSMSRRSVFPGRDSIELGCWGSAGADPHRHDFLLDAGSGALAIALDVAAGVAWYQIDDEDRAADGSPRCQARPPGGLRIRPGSVDATQRAEPEQAEAAKVDYTSGGCDQTVATQRYVVEAGKLVKKGKPRVSIARKLCKCKPKPKQK